MTKQEEFVAAVATAVMAEMDKKLDALGCPLDQTERKSVQHFYALLKDIGEGDTDRGIRLLRGLMNFVASVQTKKTIVTGAVFTTLILGMSGTAATLLWSAIKDTLRGWLLK